MEDPATLEQTPTVPSSGGGLRESTWAICKPQYRSVGERGRCVWRGKRKRSSLEGQDELQRNPDKSSWADRDLRWSPRLQSVWRQLTRPRRSPLGLAELKIGISLTPWVALGAAVVLYVALFSIRSLRNHYGFGTFGFDLGIFDQGVWLLSRFKEPFVTVRGMHLFADHTSFVLLFLVPFYWVFPSVNVLLIAQSVALGVAAVPAFLLAREKLESAGLALCISLAYLVQPAIGWTNLENFHPDVFEVPLVLFAIYFVVRRRWFLLTLCIVALLLVKEDVPLLTFLLGLYVALCCHRRVGIAIALLSVAWFVANQWVILPGFGEGGALHGQRVVGQFGGYAGFLKTTMTRPWEIAAVALGPERPWYLWQLFAPLGLLPLLAPEIVLIAMGPLLSNTLSTFGYQHNIQYHYQTLIVPVLVAAAVFGVARLASERIRTGLVGLMLVSALCAAYLWGPLGRNQGFVGDPRSPNVRASNEAIEMIPEDAGVSAFYTFVPHLTHREHIYEFPNPWRATNWGAFDREGQELPFTEEVDYVIGPESLLDGQLVERLLQTGFQRIYEAEGVLLLERQQM